MWLSGKELTCQFRRFDPWVRKIPRSRRWQSTPVSLPGESHGQRRLVGCSPQGHNSHDRTRTLSTVKEICQGKISESQPVLSEIRRQENLLG